MQSLAHDRFISVSHLCSPCYFYRENNSKIRARVIVLGDPDWIQEVSVLLCNLFDDTCCMARVTRSGCN